ncbi:MAG: SCO family protein [Bacteroidota bacterium]|nr:SCO family protein [Bacteroidota bacterium]
MAISLSFFTGCKQDDGTNKLPILGNSTIQEGPNNEIDTLYHQVSDFKFWDQDSLMVTQNDFEGKIYVADFFFTSCPTICPKMKFEMLRVYEAYKDQDDVLLLSHTIDPVHDTIPLLKSYAEQLGVKGPKWRFVTGPQDDIYELGQGSYMVSTGEDKFSPGGFMHSGAFILVDKNRRIRGVYDGTKSDQVDQLINDIPLLLKEYQN